MSKKLNEPVTIPLEVDSEIEKKALELARESNLSISELFAKIISEQASGSEES